MERFSAMRLPGSSAATERKSARLWGFTQEDTFTDVISGINNRVVGYEVRGIDWCMMPTKAYVLADEILVSHDGSMDKAGWSITVNTWSKADEEVNRGCKQRGKPV